MKKILVIYYTQTGQLKEIIDSVLSPMKGLPDFEITYEELKPVVKYDFPWRSDEFFDVFPESVEGIPCELKPFTFDLHVEYDLVILAYQVWFLSPSIPFMSFLKTQEARRLLRGKRVVTLLAVRNMWVMAQEKAKKIITAYGGSLKGNIVFIDRAPNLISIITIMKWMSTGKKRPYKHLPSSGVSRKDIINASEFGHIIREGIERNSLDDLQRQFLGLDAVKPDYVLLQTERNGIRIFRKWAKFILARGQKGDKKRLFRVRMFRTYLLFVIFTFYPVSSLLFYVIGVLFKGTAKRQMNNYYGLK